MNMSVESLSPGCGTPEILSVTSDGENDEFEDLARQMSYDHTQMTDLDAAQGLRDIETVVSGYASIITELKKAHPKDSVNYKLLADLERRHQVLAGDARDKIIDSSRARSANPTADTSGVEDTRHHFSRMALDPQVESSNQSGFHPAASNVTSRAHIEEVSQKLKATSGSSKAAANLPEEAHEHELGLDIPVHPYGNVPNKNTCYLGSLNNYDVIDTKDGEAYTASLGKPCDRTSYATREEKDGGTTFWKRDAVILNQDVWHRLPEGTSWYFSDDADLNDTPMDINSLTNLFGVLKENEYGPPM